MGEAKKKEKEPFIQAYLRIAGRNMPEIMLIPTQDEDKCKEQKMVPLRGVTYDVPSYFGESDAWNIANRISRLCEAGYEANRTMPQRNAFCEHIAHAYMVLCDYVHLFDHDWTISKETAETMIRGSLDAIVRAGKCFGFDLNEYRSEDGE